MAKKKASPKGYPLMVSSPKMDRLAKRLSVALRSNVYIRDCDDIDCPIRDECHQKKPGPCSYELTEIENIFISWLDPVNGIGDLLTQDKAEKIGYHLIPLYQRLFQARRDIFGMASKVYTDKGGKKHRYPQLDGEIDLLKAINREFDILGWHRLWDRKFGHNKAKPGEEDYERGKPGAYEEMEEE